MYAARIDMKVVAYHKDRDVVNTYAEMYQTSNPRATLEILKFKKRGIKSTTNFNDYYLEEYEDNIYIQRKYMDAYALIMSTTIPVKDKIIYELVSVILQNDPIAKKSGINFDFNDLNSAIKVIDEVILRRNNSREEIKMLMEISDVLKSHKNELIWMPSIRDLNEEYWRIENYRSKMDYGI